MATSVTLPALGESVTEGTVTRWLKQVGDEVAVDEALLEVSTDKVDTEIPSPVAGTLLEISAAEDETVDVGGRLAVIGDKDAAGQQEEPEPQPEAKQEAPKEEPREEPEQEEAPQRAAAEQRDAERPVTAEPSAANSSTPAQAPAEEPEAGSSGGQSSGPAPYVTPLVRKLAAEHSVDLSNITGSGVGGRIRKQDVLAAAEAAKPAPEPEQAAPAEAAPAAAAPATSGAQTAARPAADGPQPGSTVKLPRLRQVIAQRMTESLQVSAQLTTVQEVDVTRIARLRARMKADFERREGVKLTFLPFFAKAAIEALKQFPALNASIDVDKKEIVYHGNVHLAIAVDTPRGLLVPVIKNAEDLNIAGLAKRIADVAARTRDAKIGPDELSGGTFTITNIGSVGALFDTPIINQPQVAILGIGTIEKRPVVMPDADGADTIAIRTMSYFGITYDHRLVDGADADHFMNDVKKVLEQGDWPELQPFL